MKNFIMMTAAVALLGIGTAPSFAANCGLVASILGIGVCDGGNLRKSVSVDRNGDGKADGEQNGGRERASGND